MKRSWSAAGLIVVVLSTRADAAGLHVTGYHPNVNMYDQGAAAGPLSGSGDYVGPTWNIHAASFADFGTLGAAVTGTRENSFTPPNNTADNGLASAMSEDQITFGSGSGTFLVHMDFEGTMDVNGARFTTAGIGLRVQHGSFLETALLRELTLLYDDPTGHRTFDEHLVSDPIPFNSASSVHLVTSMAATIQLQGLSGQSMAASSDFLNTARIAYLEVRDANGNAVNTTAVGSSGHAYLVNVPEPTAASIGFALLGGLGMARRFRR